MNKYIYIYIYIILSVYKKKLFTGFNMLYNWVVYIKQFSGFRGELQVGFLDRFDFFLKQFSVNFPDEFSSKNHRKPTENRSENQRKT